MRWIKIHDSLLEWEWYGDTNMVRLWLHLLLKANYKDKKWMGKVIRRGQLVTGRVALSEELGISVQSIRTCLERLKSTNEITIKSTNKYSIITVCKYEEYQLNENEINQQTNQQLTNNQPTTNQQLTTAVEYKNIKNKEKEKVKKEKESFVAPEFEEAFDMWLEYKRQRRESYKSALSLKKCYNNLYKLANGNPNVAMAIVEQSMANNWAGLFALKQEYNGDNKERAERAKGYAATIARLAKEDAERAAGIRGQDVIPWKVQP